MTMSMMRLINTMSARLHRPSIAAALTLAVVGVALTGCKKNQTPVTEVPPPPPSERMPMMDAEPVDTAPEPVVFDVVEPAPATPAQTNTPVYIEPVPVTQTYTIRKGDTLWSIAKRFYNDGQRWQDIVAANPSITNPKKLPVGLEIVLP